MCGPKTSGSAINLKNVCYSEPMCLHFTLDPRRHYRRLPCGVASDRARSSWDLATKQGIEKEWKSQSEHGRVFTGQAERSGVFSTTRVCVPETSAARPPLCVSLSRRRGHRELLQVDGSQVWGQPFSQGGPPASRDGMCPRLAPRPWGWRPLSLVPVTKGN